MKLQNAANKVEQGNINAAVNKIQAFINQVNAFVPNHLTQEQADPLIEATNAIIVSLEGGGSLLVTVQSSATSSGESTQPVSNVGELVVNTVTVSLNDSSNGHFVSWPSTKPQPLLR